MEYPPYPENLGSIWACKIIEEAKREATATLGQIDETHELYKKYIQTVLEICTYVAGEKIHRMKVSSQGEWEIVDTTDTRSALGLPWSKYRLWKSLDHERINREWRTRADRDTAISPIQFKTEDLDIREFWRKQEHLYSELVGRNPCRQCKLLSQELEDTVILDYRVTLMGYASKLV